MLAPLGMLVVLPPTATRPQDFIAAVIRRPLSTDRSRALEDFGSALAAKFGA